MTTAFRTAKREDDKFIIRLLPGMRQGLKAQAKAHGRSMNSEVLFLIDEGMKKKGPATAPTVPDHGSTNPTKDKEMNSTETITMAAKAPAPTDKQIIDAMSDIELPISDLALMARIAADVLERLFEHPAGNKDGTLVYHVSKSERDAALFALNDVENRTLRLKELYLAGRYGESV